MIKNSQLRGHVIRMDTATAIAWRRMKRIPRKSTRVIKKRMIQRPKRRTISLLDMECGHSINTANRY